MFVLGHLGIGSKLVSPWSKGLPKKYVLLGTLFPDFIDKPLYYGLSFITGEHGVELGLISGTQTIAHTGLFLLCVATAAFFWKSRALAALALGISTHLVLDNLGDHPIGESLLWPFMTLQFPVIPFPSLGDHLVSFIRPYIFWTELAGASLLLWDHWETKQIAGVRTFFSNKKSGKNSKKSAKKK